MKKQPKIAFFTDICKYDSASLVHIQQKKILSHEIYPINNRSCPKIDIMLYFCTNFFIQQLKDRIVITVRIGINR